MVPLRYPLRFLAGSVLLLTRPLAGQGTYADPQGRFVLPTPSGWTATTLGPDAATVSGHGASVTVVSDTGTARDLLLQQQLERYRILWADFAELNRGIQSLAGRDGTFILASGTDPRGVASFLKLAGVSRGRGALVLLESAPKAAYPSLRPVLERIERGLELGAEPALPDSQPASRAFLGIATRPFRPGEEATLGLDSARGAMVSDLAPGGPAEAAGLAAGDVVVAANGKSLSGTDELVRIVHSHRPGDILALQIVRQGRPLVIRVRLGTAPPR